MQIRPKQQQRTAKHRSCVGVIRRHHGQRCALSLERVDERRNVERTGQIDHVVAVSKGVLEGPAVGQPDVGNTDAGLGVGRVHRDLPVRVVAGLGGDEHRIGVGVSHLDADHAMHPGVIDSSRRADFGPVGSPALGLFVDVWLDQLAPYRYPCRTPTRRLGVAKRDRPALGLIGIEK